MEGFYPSEVARLVLGYLKEEKCLKSWQTFLEESSNLEEYCHLYKKGKVYSTNVNGHSLLDILNEYCVLKSVCNSKIESSKNTYNISESEFLEAIRKDVFLETTKNAMDYIFQKYFPSPVLNIQSDPSSKSSNEVHLPKPKNINFSKDKFGNSCIAHENGLIVDECDKQNTVSNIAKEINNTFNKQYNKEENKKCHQDIILDNLNANKSGNNVSISKQNKNGALEKLKDQLSEEQQSTVTLNNSADASVLRSECTVKKVADSSTESIVEDDEEIEIIKEVKTGSLNYEVQNNQKASCQTDHSSPSTIPVIDVESNDSEELTANQATIVHNTITNVSSSKQEVNLQEINSARNTQENNKSPAGINQAVICYDSVEVSQINNLEHTVNASNDQSSYNINTSPFLSDSAAVTKAPLTTPRYNFLPSYALNGSFVNNNQLYFLLNTPLASNLSGSYVTAPRIQTNVTNPALPSANTTLAKTTVAAPVSSKPPIAPAGKRLVTRNTVIAPKKSPTTSNVSKSGSTPENPGTTRRSVTNLRVNKRVSYAECLEDESDEEESYSSKSDRKRKIQKVVSAKSKICSTSIADQSGQVQVSMNKEEHDTGINDSLISIVSASPRKHKKKNRKKSKTREMNEGKDKLMNEGKNKLMNEEKIKISKAVAIKTYSRQSPLVPSDNHDKLQSINSNTVPENVDELPRVNKNRVLKVMLSDVFQNSKSGAVVLHNQSDERKETENNEDRDDQINSKLTVQCRRSPRKQQEDAKHSIESKSTDTMRSKMGIKVTVPEISPIVYTKRKLLKSGGRKESTSYSSADTTVVNSRKKTRLVAFHPKNFSLKGVDFQNSLKKVTAHVTEPKFSFQKAKAIQDKYGKVVYIKMPKDNNEEYRIFMTKNQSLLSSHDVENSLKCSASKSDNNNQDPLTVRSPQNSENMVSNQITILPESVISVSGNSEFEKFNSSPEELSEKSDMQLNCEIGKNISSSVIDKDSSDSINVKNEGHDEKKTFFLTNSLSSLCKVNVSTRLETCVAKKLNFGENVLDYNSRPIINESFFSAKNNVTKEENSTKSSSEILTGESGTFSVNIDRDSTNFISHRAETSLFSVLTSISSNTQVLDIVETHTVTKPNSDVLSVSSLTGKNSNVILPFTSGQPLESQNKI